MWTRWNPCWLRLIRNHLKPWPNVFIADSLERKIESVQAHRSHSQMNGRTESEIAQFVQEHAGEAAAAGNGLEYAEAFRRITFRTDPPAEAPPA